MDLRVTKFRYTDKSSNPDLLLIFLPIICWTLC